MVTLVEITSKKFIKPSSPTPQNLKNIRLSFQDRLLQPAYIPLILFYGNQSFSNIDETQKVYRLKQSLSDVLTKFYPLAGRINGNLSLDCNDSGALYIEAQVHNFLSRAVVDAANAELDRFLPVQPYGSSGDCMNRDVPLAIQISIFQCGGIAVGVCLSHKIADMSSLVTFMNVWAATCRGETKILQPDFDLANQNFPPVREVDYGWGMPLSVCSLNVPQENQEFLVGIRSGDGIEAWISMAEYEMERLSTEFQSLEHMDHDYCALHDRPNIGSHGLRSKI